MDTSHSMSRWEENRIYVMFEKSAGTMVDDQDYVGMTGLCDRGLMVGGKHTVGGLPEILRYFVLDTLTEIRKS